MNKAVLDSSALLAHVLKEPGVDIVEALLPDVVMCSVNVCEVASKLFLKGSTNEDVLTLLADSGLEVVGFDAALALDAAALIRKTRTFGLSLGDRACLALAARLDACVLTADRAWKHVDVGVRIELIR